MTIKTDLNDDQMQMLLIVVLVGAILYMLTLQSGGICSLIRGNWNEQFSLGAPKGVNLGGCGYGGCGTGGAVECSEKRGKGKRACERTRGRKCKWRESVVETLPGTCIDCEEKPGECCDKYPAAAAGK